MPVGRDHKAALAYKNGDKKTRKDMVLYSQCDTGRLMGLFRAYHASDLAQLAFVRGRHRGEATRHTKRQRKSDFWFGLARMSKRAEEFGEHLSLTKTVKAD